MSEIIRCGWAKTRYYQEYHDNYWGKECHDDNALFELLCLESQSAGLGFGVILSKKNAYQQAFDFKNIKKISEISTDNISNIIKNFNVIKHPKKINAIIENAKGYFHLIQKYKSLDYYLWSNVDYKVSQNKNFITENELSKTISKELKQFGFQFLGSITIFAYLQAIGIYDDHQKNCFLYQAR